MYTDLKVTIDQKKVSLDSDLMMYWWCNTNVRGVWKKREWEGRKEE